MTPTQVQLLSRSFDAIGPLTGEIGRSFYVKLFELAPDARALFKNNMETQHQVFIDIFKQFKILNKRSLLTLPVTSSGNPEVSIPGIVALGERHIKYGVRPEHFVAAKKAFFWSLEQNLSGAVDDETKEAWIRAFDMIIHGMIQAMNYQAIEAALPSSGLRDAPDEGDDPTLEQALPPKKGQAPSAAASATCGVGAPTGGYS